MKVLKIVFISIISILFLGYLAFLFVLPNTINLDKYSTQITQAIEDATGFKVEARGLKAKTSWNLSGGALISRADFKYPTGEKFAQINNLEVKLSLLPLLFGKVSLDTIDTDIIILNLDVEKGGNFLIEKYITENKENPHKKLPKNHFLNLKLSSKMPDIKAKKYKITFVDMPSQKNYAIKGVNLKISDFKTSDSFMGEKIKLKTSGDLILNKRKQISYNVAVNSKVLPDFSSKTKGFDIITVFENLYKYNLSTNLDTNLKITGDAENPSFKGDLNLDKLTFETNGSTLPASSIKLKLDGEKTGINSIFYTGLNKKAVITGFFKNNKQGGKKYVDLQVVSKKTDIKNTLLIADTLLQMFGIKDLQGIEGDGNVNADFNIKSDFKTIHSKGFLRINDGDIKYNKYNAELQSINADLDFSGNSVNIKKSNATLDGQPVSIKGQIDTKANADISILAKDLNLKGFLATLGKTKLLKENDITSGLININAQIKGRLDKLDKITPTIDGVLSNVSLRNKNSGARIQLKNATLKANSKGEKLDGKMSLSDLKIIPQLQQGQTKTILAPAVLINFNEKDINITKADLYLNNSKIGLLGKITNYNGEKPNFDLTAKGLMYSSDIKSLLPKSKQAGVSAVGKIPLIIKITGSQRQEIKAQTLANQSNHMAVFDINSIHGKTSLINAQMYLSGNELKIDEITLYTLKENKGLSRDLKANISGTKIVSFRGKVFNINNQKEPILDLTMNIPNQITTSIPGYVDSSVKLKGDLNLNGSLKKPNLKGYLSIPSVLIPTMKIAGKNMGLHFNNNSISTICPQMTVANSAISFNSVILSDFSNGIVVKNIDFAAENIDLNSLIANLYKYTQIEDNTKDTTKLTILGGKSSIGKFKTAGIVASNISSDVSLKNNILKLSRLKGEAYNGKIGGEITYNIPLTLTALDLQGRNLSAGPAIKALTGMPEEFKGQLDFDSNISMKGISKEQILKSLKGNTNFILQNGKMGTLGKFEHLLHAQNVISNSIFNATLNTMAGAVMVKNTGYYKYMKGKVSFNNGWAKIDMIKTSGPTMSMYITGRYELLSNWANLVILGRISDDVVRLLGPLGDLSVSKVFSSISKVSPITSPLIKQMTTNPYTENISMIPDLTPKTELPTKEFKVIIDGRVDSQNSVKSFKWLSNPKLQQTQQAGVPQPTYIKEKVPTQTVPDFVNTLPDFR